MQIVHVRQFRGKSKNMAMIRVTQPGTSRKMRDVILTLSRTFSLINLNVFYKRTINLETRAISDQVWGLCLFFILKGSSLSQKTTCFELSSIPCDGENAFRYFTKDGLKM